MSLPTANTGGTINVSCLSFGEKNEEGKRGEESRPELMLVPRLALSRALPRGDEVGGLCPWAKKLGKELGGRLTKNGECGDMERGGENLGGGMAIFTLVPFSANPGGKPRGKVKGIWESLIQVCGFHRSEPKGPRGGISSRKSEETKTSNYNECPRSRAGRGGMGFGETAS